MTLQTINAAADTSPLPTWLAITLIVLLFIVCSVVSAYLAYKVRTAQLKRLRKTNTDNQRKELPDDKI